MSDKIKKLGRAAREAREAWAVAMQDLLPIGSVVDVYVGATVVNVKIVSYGMSRHREGEVIGVNTKTGARRQFNYTQIIGYSFSEYDRFGSLHTLLAAERRAEALAAQAKTAEAQALARNGGCGCCANACTERTDGCRFVHESPTAADMKGGAA